MFKLDGERPTLGLEQGLVLGDDPEVLLQFQSSELTLLLIRIFLLKHFSRLKLNRVDLGFKDELLASDVELELLELLLPLLEIPAHLAIFLLQQLNVLV